MLLTVLVQGTNYLVMHNLWALSMIQDAAQQVLLDFLSCSPFLAFLLLWLCVVAVFTRHPFSVLIDCSSSFIDF